MSVGGLSPQIRPFYTFFVSSAIPEPNFVYMDVVAESSDSPDGDDDKVYLFFSENAVEYDFYRKVAVSRVARVCKVNAQNLLERGAAFRVRALCLVLAGGCGRPADAAEEVDIVHEGSSRLLLS